jgi:hypothetical protein
MPWEPPPPLLPLPLQVTASQQAVLQVSMPWHVSAQALPWQVTSRHDDDPVQSIVLVPALAVSPSEHADEPAQVTSHSELVQATGP